MSKLNIITAAASPTVTELCEDYLNVYAKAAMGKRLKEAQELFKNIILPIFGSLKVESVDQHAIQTLHLQLSKTPCQANRALSLLSKIFSLAVSWGWRHDNPVRGIEKYQEQRRERWLNLDELKRFWTTLDQYPNHPMACLFKFLTLTGARKSEAAQATWDQFDLEKGIWIKPFHLTKPMERLPLSNKTLKILEQVKILNGQTSACVFQGSADGKLPKEAEVFWRTIVKTARLEDFQIRDLRNTHATHLLSRGVSIAVVAKLVGNAKTLMPRLSHLADEPLRQAVELFSSLVDELISGERGSV